MDLLSVQDLALVWVLAHRSWQCLAPTTDPGTTDRGAADSGCATHHGCGGSARARVAGLPAPVHAAWNHMRPAAVRSAVLTPPCVDEPSHAPMDAAAPTPDREA